MRKMSKQKHKKKHLFTPESRTRQRNIIRRNLDGFNLMVSRPRTQHPTHVSTVLDFLSTTDAGRLVPAAEDARRVRMGAPEEEGVWRGENGGGGVAGCRARFGCRGRSCRCSYPRPLSCNLRARTRGRAALSFVSFCLSLSLGFFPFVISLAHISS